MPDNLWIEQKDKQGNSSLQDHHLKVVWTSCKPEDHYFELTGNREVTCKKCGFSQSFILGMTVLRDGKLIPQSKL